jgi:hypothetical protein
LLYLIDACYGGIAAIGSRGLDSKSTPNYIEKITKNKSRQIITAGGRGEKVIEKSEWGHSAFTLNLNRGLRDGNADMDADGYITANELGLFLKKKVTIDSENQQTPQYGRMTSQEGEFVFVFSENTVINQNIEDTSTDVKLDLLISEIEELKSQSKSNENTTHGLQYKSNLQQIDKPLVFSFIYNREQLLVLTSKFLDKRSTIGFGYNGNTWKGKDIVTDFDHYSYGDNVQVSVNNIFTVFGYYFSSKKTILFNPAAVLMLGIKFKRIENETKQLLADTNNMHWAIGVINRVHAYKILELLLGLF